MPRRVTKAFPTECYHIFNRGALKNFLFETDEQFEHFLYLLRYHGEKCNITILAYCLMGNHFHLVVRVEANGDVSKFIKLVCSRYSARWNRRLKRSGTIYEGRFKMNHIDTASYLRAVFAYVHLNPVEAGIVKNPIDYKYSSYRECVGTASKELCNNSIIHECFHGVNNYEKYVMSRIENPDIEDPDLSQAVSQFWS